jgi:hypothetical protein
VGRFIRMVLLGLAALLLAAVCAVWVASHVSPTLVGREVGAQSDRHKYFQGAESGGGRLLLWDLRTAQAAADAPAAGVVAMVRVPEARLDAYFPGFDPPGRPEGSWRAAGVHRDERVFERTTDNPKRYVVTRRVIAIPYWPAVLVLALPPAAVLVTRLRRHAAGGIWRAAGSFAGDAFVGASVWALLATLLLWLAPPSDRLPAGASARSREAVQLPGAGPGVASSYARLSRTEGRLAYVSTVETEPENRPVFPSGHFAWVPATGAVGPPAPSGAIRFLGLVVGREQRAGRAGSSEATTAIAVPFWMLMLVLAAPFACWTILPLRRARRSLRRRRLGLCAACGYDLRGSQSRCPECGAEAGRVEETRGQRDKETRREEVPL